MLFLVTGFYIKTISDIQRMTTTYPFILRYSEGTIPFISRKVLVK